MNGSRSVFKQRLGYDKLRIGFSKLLQTGNCIAIADNYVILIANCQESEIRRKAYVIYPTVVRVRQSQSDGAGEFK